MTKIVRSGGSLNYTSGKAEKWFKSLTKTSMPIRDALIAMSHAYTIAEELCNIIDYPLDRVVIQARGRPTAEEPLLTLHASVHRKVADACRHIVPDASRWTTTSRSRWGVRLLQVIATLALTRDLNLLQAVAPEPDIAERQQTTPEDKSSGLTSSDVDQATAEQELSLTVATDVDELFRTALREEDHSEELRAIACIPDNYGIDLKGLRRLTNVLLGPMKRRDDVAHAFEAATPRLVVIDRSSLPRCATSTGESGASVASPENTIEQEVRETDALRAVEQVFPAPQWNVSNPESSGANENRLRTAINAVRRKRVTISETGHASVYAYGVMRECELAFGCGLSVIVSGISGTGKSTLLSQLPSHGATVFEIGTESGSPSGKRYHYRFDQLDELLKRAKRTKGRKIFICHEFFITQDILPKLSIFDQFAFAGDSRQPGAGDTRHLFDFIRAIGGRQFTLRVVWRVGHPLSTMVANYFAYGCQFKLCERKGVEDDRQFDVIECEDSARVIAECMVVYALKKAKQNRSVIIAAGGQQLVAAIESVVQSIGDVPSNIRCRYLSDLQGRETDTLVFDLRDVASSYQKPDEGLRFVVMLLGRARHTTSVVLGTRNMASNPRSALPIEVFFGVLMRYRIRLSEKRPVSRPGPNFEKFSEKYYLSMLDEQTIKVCCHSYELVNITIVQHRSSHNATMLMSCSCVIEAPSFFDHESNLEREIAIIYQFIRSGHIPRAPINSLSEIERFISSR